MSPPIRALCLPLVMACGGGGASTSNPPVLNLPRAAAAEPARVPRFAVVDVAWVRAHLKAPDVDVEAWGNDPSNAKAVVPGIRHILIKLAPDAKPSEVTAALNRAKAALVRVQHEDFAKVADELSEDRGTQRNGGVLPAEDLSMYVKPFADAAEALAPGELAKQPVRTLFGFHVIKREPLDIETKRAAFRKARARDVAQKLAQRIGNAPPDAIPSAIREVLEERALTSEARPRWSAFDAFDAGAPEDPACARATQAALASRSPAVLPLEHGEGFVVVVVTMDAAFRPPPSRCER
jgi:hypothetical protein